jgi:hypothetical protein
MVSARWKAVVMLAAAAILAAACSVSRLAYLNAPPLALWYVGGYFEMSDAQKGFFKDRLARAMAWHRSHELPEYQRTLEALIAKSEGTIPVADVRNTYVLARDYYHRALEHLLPDLADFVLQIDEEQLAQVAKKFEEDNKKYVKESLKGPADERKRRLTKKYIDQFEEWTGPLAPQQREIITNGVARLPDLTDERLGDRRYRQLEALNLVRSKPTREKVISELKRLLIDTESWRRPEFVKKTRDRDERIFEIVSEVSATLNAEQRTHLQRKLRGYVKDISSIVASR